MLTIEDIKIDIKKYDRKKNVVFVNIILFEQLEMRGFTVRFTETRFSHGSSVWVVTPPSIRGIKGAWFHIVRFTDSALWDLLKARIIEAANEHANSFA